MDLLEDEGFDRASCVVDADWDRINGSTIETQNVWMTDCHDMDATIFSTDALETYLKEYGNQAKMETESRSGRGSVRDVVLQAAEPIGRLRWINELEQADLNFKDLRYEFINRRTLFCDESALLDAVFANSTRPKLDRPTVGRLMDRKRHHGQELLQLCCGHDVAAALGIALREMFGERRDVHTWASEIEGGLRVAFDREAFSSTSFCRSMRAWADSNQRFPIFKF
jgi:hypothetical protein